MKRLVIFALLSLFLLAGCHKGDLVFHLITPPPPVPAIEPSLVPTVTPTPCDILGNIDAQGVKRYFLPGMRNYGQVKISPEKGEAVFCSEADAQAAGFVKAGN